MPIAGLGSRFSITGIETPKPLILVKGKRMVEWAVKSLPFTKKEDYIFVIRKEHDKKFQLSKELKYLFGNKIKIVIINELTEGAACTALKAKDLINNNEELIVMDCDHFFKNENYMELIKDEKLDGVIPVFKTDKNPKWSFTKVDKNFKATMVAEKNPISNYANIGAYYFKRGSDFVRAAEKMIKKNLRVNNEFYIAPVYQQLIEEGSNIQIAICSKVWGLGTPEDVSRFEMEMKND